MTLTADQIKDIADDLEVLGAELADRDWNPDMSGSVLTAAVAPLVSVAAMRAPLPQQAYFAPPPPYPYEPEDSGTGASRSVPLQVTVTGGSRQELEDRARQAGLQVFGDGPDLDVTLTGAIVSAGGITRDGVTQYQCSAIVRQREPLVTPRGGGRYSDTPLG